MGRFIYLDDERKCPEGWVLVRTAEEALHELAKGDVERISLDHDLGDPVKDGTWLVNQMIRLKLWSNKTPMVHSMNPVGAQRMKELIRRYGPY
jgi:hypothetical protein